MKTFYLAKYGKSWNTRILYFHPEGSQNLYYYNPYENDLSTEYRLTNWKDLKNHFDKATIGRI